MPAFNPRPKRKYRCADCSKVGFWRHCACDSVIRVCPACMRKGGCRPLRKSDVEGVAA